MRRTWTARLGVGVVVVAAMAVGRWVSDAVPLDATADAPFREHAAVGQVLHLRFADVTVLRTRVSRATSSASTGVLAGGRFLLVDLRVVARGEPLVAPQGLVLRDRAGREYWSTQRAGCTFGTAPTGVPWYASACFDVPRSALVGATFELSPGQVPEEQRRDDIGVVDLGITGADVDRLWDTRDQLLAPSGGLTPTRVEPLEPPAHGQEQ